MAFQAYENQLIGAFIFALGRMSQGAVDETITVNLFQQTPLDRSFGDLVVGSHRCFVLEFKRNLKAVASERAKWSEAGLRSFGDRMRIKQARRGHHVVYGKTENGLVDMRMCGYVDALSITRKPNLDRGPATTIISYLATGKFSTKSQPTGKHEAEEPVLGLLPAETMAYLKWLLALKKKDGKAKGGGEVWLGIATSENGVSYVAADSLESLIEIERTPVLQVERATPPRDRGPER